MSQKKKSISSQASWFFLGRASSFCITVLVPIVLVRIFSQRDFGIYRQALLIYILLFRVFQFGMRHALFYFLPHDEENKNRYVTNTVLLFALIGLINFLLLSHFSRAVSNMLNAPELASFLPLVGIYISLMLIASPFESILVIESRAEIAALVAFLTEILKGIFIIALVLKFGAVFWAIVGLISYSAIRCAVYMGFVVKRYGISITTENFSKFKKQLAYAAPMGFSGVIGGLSKRFERFVLSALFNPSIFAVYSVGNFNVPFVNMLFISVSEVVLPRMVSYLKKEKFSEFLALWRKLITGMSFVGIGAFFLLQTVAYDLITLIYTEKYSSSVIVFRIAAGLLLSNMVSYGLILRSTGHTKEIFVANFIAFLTAIFFTYFLVRYFGLVGAACSAVLVFNANALSQLILSARKLRIKFVKLLPLITMLRLICIGCAIFIVLYLLQVVIPVKILRIVFSSALFLILYILLCYETNTFNVFREELLRKFLTKVIPVKDWMVNG